MYMQAMQEVQDLSFVEVSLVFSGSNLATRSFHPNTNLNELRRNLEYESLIDDKLLFQNPQNLSVISRRQEAKFTIDSFSKNGACRIELIKQTPGQFQEEEESKDEYQGRSQMETPKPQLESAKSHLEPAKQHVKPQKQVFAEIDQNDATVILPDNTIKKLGQNDILSLLKKVSFLHGKCLLSNLQVCDPEENLFASTPENMRLDQIYQHIQVGYSQDSRVTVGKYWHHLFSQGYLDHELVKEADFYIKQQPLGFIDFNEENNKTFVYAEINFPKITLNLPDIRSIISDQAKAFFRKNEQVTREKVKRFFETFGMFVPERITLGGKYFVSHQINPGQEAEAQSRVQKDLYSAIFDGQLRTFQQKYVLQCSGDQYWKDSPTDWMNNLAKDFNQWEIISVDAWSWSYDCLNDDLKREIKDLLLSATQLVSINGDVYQGETINRRSHGKGKMKYANGDFYEGEWKNGKPEGTGKFIWVNGDVYKGSFVNGKREGKGGMEFVNGNWCNGDWVNDQLHGKGKYTWTDVGVYDGDWINGQREGKGSYYWATTKDSYDGEWMSDTMNGFGVYNWPDKRQYRGNWVNDLKEGQGKMTWPNGQSYDGGWVRNRMEGTGTFVWEQGYYYKGDWKNQKREGKGTLVTKNGDTYTGDWVNDKKHGKGEQKYANGDVYVGEWVNNMREGKGKITFQNRDVYNGEWENNRMDGNGTYTWTDGRVYTGNWVNGRRDGRGTLTWKNGDKYEGDWVNQRMEGRGKYTWANGKTYDGEWVNNQAKK